MTAKRRTKGAAGARAATILERITPEYVESSAKAIVRADVQALVGELEKALGAFDEPPLDRLAREARLMAGLVRDSFAGEYDASYWSVAVATFTLQYVLKPVDIVPDELPVIGQLDDAIIVAHAVDLLRVHLEAYDRWARSRR